MCGSPCGTRHCVEWLVALRPPKDTCCQLNTERTIESKLGYRKLLLSPHCEHLKRTTLIHSSVVNCGLGWNGKHWLALWTLRLCPGWSGQGDYSSVAGKFYRVDDFPDPGGRDPVTPQKTTTGTVENRVFPFFSSPDSYISGNFAISPLWLVRR